MAKAPSMPPSRGLTVRVKSAKSRSTASARWLARQLNDPYVAAARQQGWRSRAAFKLLELGLHSICFMTYENSFM